MLAEEAGPNEGRPCGKETEASTHSCRRPRSRGRGSSARSSSEPCPPAPPSAHRGWGAATPSRKRCRCSLLERWQCCARRERREWRVLRAVVAFRCLYVGELSRWRDGIAVVFTPNSERASAEMKDGSSTCSRSTPSSVLASVPCRLRPEAQRPSQSDHKQRSSVSSWSSEAAAAQSERQSETSP